jgi:hypothetical protein
LRPIFGGARYGSLISASPPAPSSPSPFSSNSRSSSALESCERRSHHPVAAATSSIGGWRSRVFRTISPRGMASTASNSDGRMNCGSMRPLQGFDVCALGCEAFPYGVRLSLEPFARKPQQALNHAGTWHFGPGQFGCPGVVRSVRGKRRNGEVARTAPKGASGHPGHGNAAARCLARTGHAAAWCGRVVVRGWLPL